MKERPDSRAVTLYNARIGLPFPFIKGRARRVSMLVASAGQEADVFRTVDLVLVCHAFGAEGFPFGPDLGTVSHWSPHAMLEAIIAPSRSVTDGYETWRIERRGRDIFTGVIRAETGSAVTLAMEGGVEITVPRTEIETMAQLGGSSMPEGLEERISVQEMADLIAFLTSGP